MRWFLVVLLCLFIHGSVVAAEGGPRGRFAGGFSLGSIFSINGKLWVSQKNAFDFGLGFTGGWTMIYVDYLWHIPGLFGSDTRFGRETQAYFGAGGGLAFWSSREGCGRFTCATGVQSGTGGIARAFFGGEWVPARLPLGVYAEAGPTLTVAERAGGVLDILVGARYYF